MQTIDSLLSQNPRYAKTTEGVWEKAEPSNFAMSVNAGPAQVCEVTPRGNREPGAWADEEFANAMLIVDAKRNAALAMLVDDLIAACARAEKDYRQLVDSAWRRGARLLSADHQRRDDDGGPSREPGSPRRCAQNR